MRFLFKISYDGSNYFGYQRQNGLKTIQEKLEDALRIINAGKTTNIISTGRTDRGVHALSQYAHADIDINITPQKLKRAMNSNLPDDIHVISVKKVPDDFHARYNVKKKEYRYYMNLGEYNPIEKNYVYQYNYKLNIEKMSEAIKYFEGKHDFRAFVTENKDKINCVRTIEKVNIRKLPNKKIVFIFVGDGFMRYQIRNMVGILIMVGQEKITPSTVKEILDSKDRSKNGKTAPSQGLYLTKVIYKRKFLD